MAKYRMQCGRCGHPWVKRKLRGKPKQCPKCHSFYWNKPRVRKVAEDMLAVRVTP